LKLSSGVLRRRDALSLAIAVSLTSTAGLAATPQLRLLSGDANASTAKVFPVQSIGFQLASGVPLLTVNTRAGNVSCGTVGSFPSTIPKLRLDGADYPLAVFPLPAGLASPQGSGHPIQYVADHPDGNPLAGMVMASVAGVPVANCVSSNQFGSVAAGGVFSLLAEDQQPVDIAQAVYYDVATRAFEVRSADPILCESYGSGGVSLVLAGPNNPQFSTAPGDAKVLAGFASVGYAVAQRSLRPVAGELNRSPLVQCSTPGAAGSGGGPVPTNSLFGSGFEISEGSANVKVFLTVNGQPAPTIGGPLGQPARIGLRVQNDGPSIARNVRIREYAPLQAAFDAGLSAVRIDKSGSDSCVVAGGTAPCSGQVTDPAFPLSFDIAQLGVGEAVEFTLNRATGAGATGASTPIGFAAFVDPAASNGSGPDLELADNMAWSTFAVS
jgi:hypothetical protein